MTAKEFLKRFKDSQQAIDNSLKQVEALQSLATQTTTVIKSVPIGGAKDVSRIESSVVGIHKCTRQLADELAHAVDVREEIANAIARVKNSDERCLLELRYLCLDSWEEISGKMNFSIQGIFKLHSRALKNFPFEQSVE